MSTYITLEEIRQIGQDVAAIFKDELDVVLKGDKASVEWIDGYINRNRVTLDGVDKWGLAVAFGYIVGEAIINEYHGKWEYSESQDQWVVAIKIGKANPIGKIAKCLESEYESISSFYRILGIAIEKVDLISSENEISGPVVMEHLLNQTKTIGHGASPYNRALGGWSTSP